MTRSDHRELSARTLYFDDYPQRESERFLVLYFVFYVSECECVKFFVSIILKEILKVGCGQVNSRFDR